MKYKDYSLGQIESILNKLGGPNGVDRFLSGRTVLRPVPQKFKIWRTVKVGNNINLIDAVMEKNWVQRENSPYGDKRNTLRYKSFQLLHCDTSTTYETEKEIALVVVTPQALGFKEYTPCKEVYDWAKLLGLELCMTEVGPQILIQQPSAKIKVYEDVLIASKPIYLAGDCPYLFRVTNKAGYAKTLDCDPYESFGPETNLVFSIPMNSPNIDY